MFMARDNMLPPRCHDEPGALQPTCFSLQPGQNLSCSFQEDSMKVTSWYSISRSYTGRGRLPSTRGCHPFHLTTGASWCLSIISTDTSDSELVHFDTAFLPAQCNEN